jgi:hypothetical protein
MIAKASKLSQTVGSDVAIPSDIVMRPSIVWQANGYLA